jgi:hypothetical protein
VKFDAQTDDIIPRRKIPKQEVAREIQDVCHRRLEFHIIWCHVIDNCPISSKFCTHAYEVASKKKFETALVIQDGSYNELKIAKLLPVLSNTWHLQNMLHL